VGKTLAAGASCTIKVQARPSADGKITAVLTIGAGDSVTVPIAATAVPPGALTLGPARQDFVATLLGENGETYVFTATNTGGAPTGPIATDLSGTGSDQFRVSQYGTLTLSGSLQGAAVTYSCYGGNAQSGRAGCPALAPLSGDAWGFDPGGTISVSATFYGGSGITGCRGTIGTCGAVPTTQKGWVITKFGTEQQGVNWCTGVVLGRCIGWAYTDAAGNRSDKSCPYPTNRTLGISFSNPVG
jgi:hypothetical protein